MKVFLHSATILTLSAIISSTSAQTSFLYTWSFEDGSIQTTIPTCTRLPITITPGNGTTGTPPYYMTALAIDVTPSTTLIGTKENNASYIVDYPIGTLILFSVTDSNGNPGGTFAPMTVVAGTSTTCVVTPSTSTFTMSSNVTSALSTCDPLGITIRGGVLPYTLSLIAANSPAVTNVTLPAGDNIYTYINRAAPGGQLVAAVSDSTGSWASGAALFNTEGTTDSDCSGLISSSGKYASSSTSSSLPKSSTTFQGSSSNSASTTKGGTTTTTTNGSHSGTTTSTGSAPAATTSGNAAFTSQTHGPLVAGIVVLLSGLTFIF